MTHAFVVHRAHGSRTSIVARRPDRRSAHHGVFAAHHLDELQVSRRPATASARLPGRWESSYTRVSTGSPACRGSWRGDLLAACWAGGARARRIAPSAAALWDLPGGTARIAEITCPRWRRAQHDGLDRPRDHRADRADVTVVDGIPVTTVERTIFDLAAVCSRFTVDLAIDNALRQRLTTLDELVRDAPVESGRRGRKGTTTLARTARRPRRRLHTDRERARADAPRTRSVDARPPRA